VSFEYQSIGFWIERRAFLGPERVAVEFGDRVVTYADLDRGANRTAAFLRERGVGPGDRVATFAGNSVEMAELFFACAKTGAILVPLNTRLAEAELEYM